MLQENKVETKDYVYKIRKIKDGTVMVDSYYKAYDDVVYGILTLKEDESGKKWVFKDLPDQYMDKKADNAYKEKLFQMRFETVEDAIQEWEKSYE